MTKSKYFSQTGLWNNEFDEPASELLSLVAGVWASDIGSILDAGCGNGRLLDGLSKVANVTGVDLSFEALVKCEHPVVNSSLESLPFADRSFDASICVDVLEHLNDRELKQTCSELARVSDKHILIACPNHEPLETQLTQCQHCQTKFHPNGHIQSIDKQQIQQWFSADFECRVYSYYGNTWRKISPLGSAIELASGIDPHSFAFAMCPACTKIQGDKLRSDIDLDSAHFLAPALFENPTQRVWQTEIFVWLTRKESPQSILTRPTYGTILVCALDEQVLNEGVMVETLDASRVAANACAEAIGQSLQFPVHVCNANTNWGELVEDTQGGVCRLFGDFGGADGWAPVCFPVVVVAQRTTFVFGFRDVSEQAITVLVRDTFRGYLELGNFGGTADQQWKQISFELPQDFIATGEIIMICFQYRNGMPSTPVPIGEMYFAPLNFEASWELASDKAQLELDVQDNWSHSASRTMIHAQKQRIAIIGNAMDNSQAPVFLGAGRTVPLPSWWFLEGEVMKNSRLEVSRDNKSIRSESLDSLSVFQRHLRRTGK
ncbi:MAG: class I SAM-dependent methyltransferase [Robiginitomaculum sp.]|nr:class I SAM-dependent methyltransferase [Robiginitomaculum sp.]